MPTGKTVLIADDDRDLLEVLALRCRKLGLEVRTASSGLDAFMEAASDAPDLLILDINMPAGDGLRVWQKLMHYPGFRSIPVIFLTGRIDPETLRDCDLLDASYVFKDHRAWPTIHGMIRELFQLETH